LDVGAVASRNFLRDDPVLRQDADRRGALYLIKPVMSSQLLALIRGGAVTDETSASG
jgi:hypothetical protein